MIKIATIKLRCPSCHGDDVKGKGKGQKRQFFCNNIKCSPYTFKLDYIVYEAENYADVEKPKADDGGLHRVQCPSCSGGKIRKFGKRKGKQIYKCNNLQCPRTTFRQDYDYKACDPRIKSHISDLVAQGNSTRAIGRMLSISKDTVTNALKKLDEDNLNNTEN